MAREDPLIRVRLPEALKTQIQAEAAENRRSMNAEIVARLEASVSSGGDGSGGADERIRWLEREVDALLARVRALEIGMPK